MSSRRRARAYALQALYVSDVSGVPVSDALNGLWTASMDGDGLQDEHTPASGEVEFAQRLCFGVHERSAEIDALIEESSTHWRVVRMPAVDRNILRMAACELMTLTDVPATVTINEAIELAKRFSTSESGAFVNGIVDRLARKLGRLKAGSRRRSRRRS